MLENLSMYQAVKLTAEKNPNYLAVYYQNTKILKTFVAQYFVEESMAIFFAS